MRDLATYKRVSEVGPHGIGKTSADAIIVHWFARTREAAGADWKVVTTAGAWRQLQFYLWPEIAKWAKRLVIPYRSDELQKQQIKLNYGQAFPVASDNPANIEGAHADEILYIIDEAKNVPPDTWDAIEGAMSAGHAYCLATSTPGKAEGRLYEIHQRQPGFDDWRTIHVRLEDAIAAGRISREWAEARAKQWGETSPVYLNRVLGEFSTTDSDGVIPLDWLEAANDLWNDLKSQGKLEASPLVAVAADLASEQGVDYTVIGTRHGNVLSRIIVEPALDTMAATGKIVELLNLHPAKSGRDKPTAVPDAIGIGTGVVDRLREQGYRVDAFMGSQKALRKDKTGEITFLNRRAEAWWGLRDLLNPAFDTPAIAIPDDPMLIGDLLAPHWDQTSTGHIKIEEKDDVRKRLGRSPDRGDMVCQAFNVRLNSKVDLTDALPIGLGQTSRWRGR